MRTAASIVAAAAVWAPLGCLCSAQSPSAQEGFDAYRMIQVRNIFDPQRQPMSTPAAAQPRAVEPPPRAADFVTLTGVMVNDGKALAFFSGSRADYDKVLEANGEIAGAKVAKITPEGIEVERAGRAIRVAVGQTVPFDNSAPGPAPATASEAVATAPAPVEPGSTPLPGNLNEVMRRMMERRQKELQ